MSVLSAQELRALAREFLVDEKHERDIEEMLERGDKHSAAINLLGTLDAKVEAGKFSDQVAMMYYLRLGFSNEEMSGFRQYAAERNRREGRDLPKKLS